MPSTDPHGAVERDPVRRLRRLAVAASRWVGGGLAVGVVVSLALLVAMSPKGATDMAFALGALVLGFGVLAWSGAIGLGETIEGMQQHLDVSSGWTQAGARRAFFVISWTGAGWVLGAVAMSFALGVS